MEFPSSAIICGPTGSGKTYFVKKVLHAFAPKDMPIVWFHGSGWQPLFNDMEHVEFVSGFTALREGAINVIGGCIYYVCC